MLHRTNDHTASRFKAEIQPTGTREQRKDSGRPKHAGGQGSPPLSTVSIRIRRDILLQLGLTEQLAAGPSRQSSQDTAHDVKQPARVFDLLIRLKAHALRRHASERPRTVALALLNRDIRYRPAASRTFLAAPRGSAVISHSQTRTTTQPRPSAVTVACLSRSRVRAIFASHSAAFGPVKGRLRP